jgi:2-polyprenyl-3-methyl-5-hydroxy-6-metoxy-1,4-benzoquinol methylase
MNYEKIYEEKNSVYYTHSRSELMPYIPQGIKTALDIGCGTGVFGSLLKSRYPCQVWGIEPNKASALEAEKKLDKVVNSTFFRNMPELISQKFDIIFFNDVLEHLVDPEEALDICKSLLNANGYILASIPNIRWYPVILSLLRYRDFKYEVAGVMDKTHLRFFTLKSMLRLFKDNGYKIITSNGINKSTSFKFFNLLNLLLFNSQWDMKFPQFVIVATINNDSN